ncbi:hypothetical protein D3C76_1089500 [compost metagenome]
MNLTRLRFQLRSSASDSKSFSFRTRYMVFLNSMNASIASYAVSKRCKFADVFHSVTFSPTLATNLNSTFSSGISLRPISRGTVITNWKPSSVELLSKSLTLFSSISLIRMFLNLSTS